MPSWRDCVAYILYTMNKKFKELAEKKKKELLEKKQKNSNINSVINKREEKKEEIKNANSNR